MKVNANIYVDDDGVLCVEIAAGYGDAIKLHNADECLEFLQLVSAEANKHFGTQFTVVDVSISVGTVIEQSNQESYPYADELHVKQFKHFGSMDGEVRVY